MNIVYTICSLMRYLTYKLFMVMVILCIFGIADATVLNTGYMDAVNKSIMFIGLLSLNTIVLNFTEMMYPTKDNQSIEFIKSIQKSSFIALLMAVVGFSTLSFTRFPFMIFGLIGPVMFFIAGFFISKDQIKNFSKL